MRKIVLGIFLLFVGGCHSTDQELQIKVDMASLHDEGLFKPEEGDKLSIAGNFNNWQANEYMLSDNKGDWIFSLNMNELPVNEELNFKFVISSDKKRDIANGG